MALCDDFLKQARSLVRRRGRPSQINLRRAQSAAYYALFHLIVREVSELMIPADPPSLRARVGRAFQHGEVRAVCNIFKGPSLSPMFTELTGSATVSDRLRLVAKTFLQLQDERHAADYDTLLTLSQPAVMRSISDAEIAFRTWASIRGTPELHVFLAAVAFSKRWDR